MKRQLVIAVLSLGLIASGCSGSDSGSDSTIPTGGSNDTSAPVAQGWTFTDDFGTEIALDEAPDVIVASPAIAGALWEYGIEVQALLGSSTRMDGSPNPALGTADGTNMVSLADVTGVVDLEALAAVGADVAITESWGEGDTAGLEPDERATVESEIAPVVVVSVVDTSLPDVLERVGELALSLAEARGDADAALEAQATARSEFDTASAHLSDAATDDLVVMAASGSPQEFYVARPEGYADLQFYAEAGVRFVEPTSEVSNDPRGAFWETLSWEEATKYHADVILADARFGGADWAFDMIPGIAQRLPATVAQQVVEWELTYAFGYRNVAEIIERLAEVLSKATPLQPAP